MRSSRPGNGDDVVRVDVQLAQQQLQHVRAHRVDDLEPHRRPEPAAGQLAFEGLQQVFVAVLLDLQVRVARDPEGVALRHLHAGEELRQVRGDEVLDRQEGDRLVVRVLRGDPDQARHVVGHLHAREPLGTALGVADGHGQVEREAGDVGERVRGVDGQRRQHREHGLGEVGRQRRALAVGQRRPPVDPDALLVQLRAHLVEEDLRVRDGQRLRPRGDAGQLLARGEPVRAAHLQAGLVAALQPGDADHVELVQVAREDRQELGPLQQRLAGVLGQREHAGVEVQPRQLAVEVAVVGQAGGVGDGPGRRHHGHGGVRRDGHGRGGRPGRGGRRRRRILGLEPLDGRGRPTGRARRRCRVRRRDRAVEAGVGCCSSWSTVPILTHSPAVGTLRCRHPGELPPSARSTGSSPERQSSNMCTSPTGTVASWRVPVEGVSDLLIA